MSPKLMLLVGGLALAAVAQDSNPNFIGKIERLKDDAPGQIAYIKFEAGARTRWHVHEKGQLVFVMEGVGLEQQMGGPVRELHVRRVCRTGMARRQMRAGRSTT